MTTETVKQLADFLSNPTNWFALGAIFISLTYVILYDVIWTIVPDEWADFWFERAQGWLKIGVYVGVYGVFALFVFTPWPWNLIVVASIAIAAVLVIVWLKKTNRI